MPVWLKTLPMLSSLLASLVTYVSNDVDRIIAARRHMTQQMLEPRTVLLNCYYTVFAIPNPSCALLVVVC